jgi:cytochrome c-type biogenesis protein CcmH/NrfG
MAFAAISGLVVQGLWPVAEVEHPQWRFEKPIRLIAASGIVVVVIFVIRPTYQSEALRVDARRAVDRAAAGGLNDGQWAVLLHKAHDALAQSVKLDPKNGSAWADLSYVLALQLRFDPLSDHARAHEALEAADRALACSPAVAEFWVWRGVARDAVGSRADAESDYARAVELAPTKPSVWYYQAAHYAVEDSSLPRAREALATSLRLDPFNPQAHALFKRLAARGLAH